MHKQNINYIIDHGTNEQMRELKDVLVEAVIKLKDLSPTEYKDVEYNIHKIAHSGKVGDELAKQWVDCMENKDGTTGAHWTWEQVAQVHKERKMTEDMAEFYTVLNMMYSDYYSPRFDVNTYVEMAKDWINDADAPECKTLKYYYYVIHK